MGCWVSSYIASEAPLALMWSPVESGLALVASEDFCLTMMWVRVEQRHVCFS